MNKEIIEILEKVIYWNECTDKQRQIICNYLSKKSLKERLIEFKSDVYSKNYPMSMLEEFCDYWTEHNEKGHKMKFEMQKTFNINLRLKQWARRSKNYQNNSNQVNNLWSE